MCEGIKRMHTTSKWINWPACLFLYQFVHSRVGHTTFFHSVANLDEEVSLSLLCSINLLTPCNRLQLILAAVTSPSQMCLTWWPCQLLQGDQDVGCPIIFHCEVCFSVYLLSYLFSGQCLHLWCKPCLHGRWWKFLYRALPNCLHHCADDFSPLDVLQLLDPTYHIEINYGYHSYQ